MSQSIYKVPKFFMISAGIWKLPISTNSAIKKIYTIYSIGIQTLFVCNIFLMIFKIAQLLQQSKLEEVYIPITLAILVIEITYKVLIYVKNGIPYLYGFVIEREENINKETDLMKQIYLKEVKYFRIVNFCQCFCVSMGIIYFIGVNVYNKYITGLTPDEHFMYQIWFPFDETKHDTFVTGYNLFMALYGFLFNCASISPMQSLVVFATSQLKFLQLNLRKCLSMPLDDRRTEELKRLAREHQVLIE